jgi:uncharacterized oxidoreductase
MNLSNNTILITGGATGIGLALAEQFLSLGNKVLICGRTEENLVKAKEKFPAFTATRVSDIMIEHERIRLYDWITRYHSDFNILINNAGIQNEIDLSEDCIIDLIQNEVDTNFVAPVHLSNLFIPHLLKKQYSAIINITSGLAFTPIAAMPIYCATKAAMHSLTLSLRHQLSKTPIKVFELIPPTVDTNLDRGARANREQSDRGISAKDFAVQAIEALKNDVYEAAIGQAAGLRAKREEMFPVINRH